MIRPVLTVLLLSALALAQSVPNPQPAMPQAPAPAAAPKPAELPASAAVITVMGFCPSAPSPGAECKTEITRAEFERLVRALNPAMPEATKRQLANAYARMLVMAKLADDRGITKKPETQDVLRFSQLQTLSQLFVRDLQEEAAKIAPADIEKYYTGHAAQYVQASLNRIFIPKMPPNAQEKADEATVKAEGTKIAGAAKVAGADFGKLQKEAYDDLKITATPPPVELKDVRRDALPPGQAKAFDLGVGEVSDAIDEPGGIYIYKVVAKKILTQAEVEADIRKALEQERMQASVEKLTGNIKPELNEAYFGGGEPPKPPPSVNIDAAPKTAPTTKSRPAATKAPAAAPKSTTAPKTPK